MPNDSRPRYLDRSDVERLLHDTSPQSRALTAERLARQYNDGGLSAREQALAEEVLRTMVRDAAVRVRKVLSENLKDSPELPRDVAITLARDVSDVAIPMVQFTEVLTDEDLIEIVRDQTRDVQCSVARRKRVSPVVSDALVDTGDEQVVSVLVNNERAEIAEPTYKKVVDGFADQEEVNTALATRKDLPVRIAEQLVAHVSDHLRDYLISQHNLSPDIVGKVVAQSRERATLATLKWDADGRDVDKLVTQLHGYGRLTPSIVVRALCLGDIHFFEVSLATLAGIPVENARMLIFDKGGNGLRALYERCEMPLNWLPIAQVAIAMLSEAEKAGQTLERQEFRDRVIESLLTGFADSFDADALKFLVEEAA